METKGIPFARSPTVDPDESRLKLLEFHPSPSTAATWGDLTRDELENLATSDYSAAPVARALLNGAPAGF